ncbi:hypothetical protein ABK040_002848 [Willaertia magna]
MSILSNVLGELFLITCCWFGVVKSFKSFSSNSTLRFSYSGIFLSIICGAILGIINFSNLNIDFIASRTTIIYFHKYISKWAGDVVIPILLPFSIFQSVEYDKGGYLNLQKDSKLIVAIFVVLLSICFFYLLQPFYLLSLNIPLALIVMISCLIFGVINLFIRRVRVERKRQRNIWLIIMIVLIAVGDNILKSGVGFGSLIEAVDIFHVLLGVGMICLVKVMNPDSL